MRKIFIIAVFLLGCAIAGRGQFVITKQAVAPGGQSSGGPFAVSSTVGESSCGSSNGGAFSTNNGYNGGGSCAAAHAAPTAAQITISGRAVTRDGSGIKNVVVTLTDGVGTNRSVRTNAFGYFEFTAVPSAGSYVVEATGRKYSFAPMVVQGRDDLTGLVLTAQ